MMHQEQYELFASRLDWNNPALAEAAKSYQAGRLEEAVSQVIAHFRTRTNPVYLFKKSDVHCDDKQVFVEAEKTMKHDIFGHKFNGPIDWHFNPTAGDSRDNEWSWSLYRTLYWQPLARAYAQTGDEKYVKEFVEEMRSFVEAWPVAPFMDDGTYAKSFTFPAHAWRTLESGARIYTTWLPCLEIFRDSPAFDDESFVIFLNAIWDHAEFLSSHYSNHKSSSNWLSMEVTALLQMGVLFPEFKNAHAWYVLALRRFSQELCYDFDENGAHMERTPVYHLTAAISFLQAYLTLVNNQKPVPPYAWPILVKTAEYVMDFIKPDLSTPMMGDADREDFTTSRSDCSPFEGMNLSFWPQDLNEIRAYFLKMSELTGRDDFRFFATQRKEGKAPKKDDCLREGIYIMRSGYEPDDDFLMVHGVNIERGEKTTHSHWDQGHVELMARGEDILVDCGRYVYNSSVWKDWRHYFTFQPTHNVLDVDGYQMGQFPGQVERIRGVRTFLHAFEKNDDYWLIDISHNGYAYLDDPVWQRRKVLRLSDEVFVIVDFVTGNGEGEHEMRWYLNFPPRKMEELGGSYLFTTQSGKEWKVKVYGDKPLESKLYEGSLDPKYGWISYGYSLKQPTPEIVTSYKGTAPIVVATVIAPPEASALCTVEPDKVTVSWKGGKKAVITLDGVEVKR